MAMAPSAVDIPPPSAGQPSEGSATPSLDRHLHAQDSERVYQAAGTQIILDRTLPTPAAATNTLPRDIATFAGRSDEVDKLLSMVRQLIAADRPIPIITVDGMPGVGKTKFAVHVAHQLAPVFTDGQFYIDMHAHTAGKVPTEPTEALVSLLSVDGTPAEDIPDDVDGRSARWRARMADRRSILIIDNVANHQQVEPLLPGSAGCLTIVTSRRRLTGLGARYAAATVPLDPLPSRLAAELFFRLIGRDADDGQEQAVIELVQLCGCLPLAIALLAARLRPEPNWRVRALVDDLAATQNRLAYIRAEDIQVAAAFDVSYQSLSTARRRFFRQLGLSPGVDFDAHAAAALTGIGVATARQHLDALYEDHLVEQPVQGRYRLHDLLGVYTRTLIARDSAAQRDLAIGRLLDYYQHTSVVADSRLAARPHRPLDAPVPRSGIPALADAAQAAAWMDAELPNLLACATYAINQGDDKRLIGLSGALASFLRRAGPYQQSIALHRAAADAADRRGERAARAPALYEVGVLLRRAGDYAGATQALSEARWLYRDLNDQAGEAGALTAAGIVRRLAGDYRPAIDTLEMALHLYEAVSDPAGRAEVLDELAVVRWLTDDYPEAARLLDQALSLYRRVGNSQGQADVLLHLGIVRRLQHDYPAVVDAVQQANTRYRDLGARVGIAHTQLLLGIVRRLTGDHNGAVRALDESLQTYREVGDRLGSANTLKELGILRRLEGDYPGAAQTSLEAMSIYQDLGNQLGQAGTQQDLGLVWWLIGDAGRARDDLTAALATYEGLGSHAGQAEVLNDLGMLLLETGDPQALRRFKDALGHARAVQDPMAEARALDGIGRWLLHQRDADKAGEQLRAALKIYQRIGAPEAADVEATLASLAQDQSTTRVSDDDER